MEKGLFIRGISRAVEDLFPGWGDDSIDIVLGVQA